MRRPVIIFFLHNRRCSYKSHNVSPWHSQDSLMFTSKGGACLSGAPYSMILNCSELKIQLNFSNYINTRKALNTCQGQTLGRIFSHVRPFYEPAVSNLDKSMHISVWVQVTHSSFIEGSHMTKNMAFWVFLQLGQSERKKCFLMTG